MYRTEMHKTGGSWSDYMTYGPIGSLAARRDQIIDEQASAISDDRYKDSDPKEHALSEALGIGASIWAAKANGGVIGGLISKLRGKDFGSGARIGSKIGTGVGMVATLAGAIYAAMTKRRTREEQLEHDRGSLLSSLLMPGVGIYNSFKRQGRAFANDEERIKTLVAKKIADNRKVKENNK